MYLTITSDVDTVHLQEDLDKLASLEQAWMMSFHPEKCNVLTVSRKRNIIKRDYILHGHRANYNNSDHEILEFNFKLGRNENTRSNQQSLRFFKGNYDEINRLLTNTDWNLEMAQGDIDELWNRFADKISSTY
jgi:hypothetical protein